MSGSLGVMAVLLLETAVGGAVVLWATGVWGVLRRGFFLLTGALLIACTLGAWALTRTEVRSGDVPGAGGATVTALALFAILLLLWQLLLVAGQETPSRLVGLAATVVGVASLVLFSTLRGDSMLRALAELVAGAVFLGSAFYGLVLGHWYLVERRLSNIYMVRSSWWYAAGVIAAVVAVALSASNPTTTPEGLNPLLAVPRFSVMLAAGLVAVCALIAGFVWKLAQEGGRSIQAATGMFYLAVIMAFSAELSTKVRFF